MKILKHSPLCVMAAVILACVSCKKPVEETPTTTPPETAPTTEGAPTAAPKEEAKAVVAKAVAEMKPTSGNTAKGTVTFTKAEGGIKVEVALSGLTPGQHGFHIHEKGDCSAPDASSAGEHFNPGSMAHGGPEASTRHVGDLGNIEAGADGSAKKDFVDTIISFEGTNSILGKSVIVHASRDDFMTQPTGGSGGRVACGAITEAK